MNPLCPCGAQPVYRDAYGLDGGPGVKFPLCLNVDGVSKLGAFEVPEIGPLAVGLDASGPCVAIVLRDTKQPARVYGHGSSHVLRVDDWRNVSQIADPIVVAHAIDMVELLKRPLAENVQPNESVNGVVVPINRALPIPLTTWAPGDGPDAVFAHALAPPDFSRVGAVRDEFAQARGSKIGSSHDALQKLIGQRSAGVDSTERASLFSSVRDVAESGAPPKCACGEEPVYRDEWGVWMCARCWLGCKS